MSYRINLQRKRETPPPSPSKIALSVAPARLVKPNYRILDFDIENRPISYGGGDFTFSDITSIAWGWADEDEVHCALLTNRKGSQLRMLKRFLKAYNQSDMITGHYIRNHDLGHIQGALFEHSLPPLAPKLTSDTKNDLLRMTGVSKAQESLSEMLRLADEKYHMSQYKWRQANRLNAEGLELTRTRVVNDIIQHKQLRKRLIEEGWLGPPKLWKP